MDAGGHFIFVCKPSSHPLIQEYLAGIELPVVEQVVKRGKQHFVHRYRWLQDVPLRDGKDALKVNWFDIEIVNAKGETTYRNSFVTDLPVGADTVVELAACGRARWKIENETFNVLKTNGYHLEHSFGHGKQNLAAILVSLNLLAFAIHTVCDIGDELWRAARAKLGPRYNFFSKLTRSPPISSSSLGRICCSPSLLRSRRQSPHDGGLPRYPPLAHTNRQPTNVKMRIAGMSRMWLSQGILAMPNRLAQLERPCPAWN